jgi:hypothetical protein
MSMDISSLGKKVPDRIAVALRSAVTLIPVAGGLLAEIISEIIPNQRLDRVENFLLALTTEMHLEKNTNYPKSEGPQLELLETGIRAASATSSASKIKYLAKTVSKGLTQDDGEAIRAQRLARIISELDPEEIIILLSHTRRTISDSYSFREKHPEIFDLPTLFIGSDQSVRKRNAQYEAAKRHLIALGLLSEEIEFDRDTGAAKRFGSQIEKEINITMVGRLVLHYAGLIDEI